MNELIWQLWYQKRHLAGKYIPKFVIVPGAETRTNIVFLTLNGSHPKRVNRTFRHWLQKIGWIRRENDNYSERFQLARSPLQNEYVEEEALLSAKIHLCARGWLGNFGDNQHLYPRFFRRINGIIRSINEHADQHLVAQIEYEGLNIYDYAHVGLYHWLDSSSAKIRKLINTNAEVANFAELQKNLSFGFFQQSKPRVVICPYTVVIPDLCCFCRLHGVIPNFQVLAETFNKIRFAEVDLPWGRVLIFACQNLLSARGAIGVGPNQITAVTHAIAENSANFIMNQI